MKKTTTALILLVAAAGLAAVPQAAAQGSPSTLSIHASSPIDIVPPGGVMEIAFEISQALPVASACFEPEPILVKAETPWGPADVEPSSFQVEPWVSPAGEYRSYGGFIMVETPADAPAFEPLLVRLTATDQGCSLPTQPQSSVQQDVVFRVGYEGKFAYDSALEAVPLGNGTFYRWTIEAQHVGNGPAVVDLDIVEQDTTAGVLMAGSRLVLDSAPPGHEPAVRTTTIDLRPDADKATTAVVDLAGRYAGPMPYEPEIARISVKIPAATPPDQNAIEPAEDTSTPEDPQVPAPGLILAMIGVALAAFARRRK